MEKNKYDDYSKVQEDLSVGAILAFGVIIITLLILFVKISTL